MNPNKKYVILVVDDSEAQLVHIRSVLEKFNFVLLEATNGEEVFDCANVMKPDLILLDYEMPIMDGLSVLKLLKKSEKTNEIPVIMFTAKVNIQDAFNAGAIDFLKKPYTDIELIARIKSTLTIVESFNKIKKHKQEIESYLEAISEKNKEIQTKNDDLQTQSDNLKEVNHLLFEKQEEIITQNEEIRQKSEELRNLNIAKDKFFSIIAHDLRNPMQVMIGYSSLLKNKYPNLDENKKIEYINLIEHSTRSVSSLLDNLLHWSRSQTNKIKYDPQKFDIKKIIDETIDLLELNALEKNITIESKIKDKSIAYFDSNMITTVIRNLLSNAIKFTEKNGKVTISCITKNKMLEVKITDNGIGINTDAIETIFQIDHQHSNEGTSGEKGTGLGLIICKEFVEKNCGNIRVESEIGIGSSFIISLPLKK